MKLNTNSNSYTMVYSIVLVVIVSFLLAFVYVALKPQQDKNVALDQKKQILNSLNLRGLSDAEAEATYNKVVREDSIGNKHYYNCLVKGQSVVVFPLKGMGLWGGISGFIAVNASDMNTVYGVYFNHESETAGLGAEIKDNVQWQQKFIGKKLHQGGSKQIALGVKKKVDDKATQVDAVTGATLTSNGVDAMLKTCLSEYNLDAVSKAVQLSASK